MSNNFLLNYLTVTSGSESPDIYHHWSALSTIAAVAGRKLWVDQNMFKVYPNMYVMLVGPAGIKKSTALRVSSNMALKAGMPVAPQSITKEALTQMMSKEDDFRVNYKLSGEEKFYTHVNMYANELVTQLSAGGNAQGFIELMTDIWDQDIFTVKTKGKGTDQIFYPYLNVLSCITSDSLDNLLSQRLIGSGFARRCLFVYSDDYGLPVPIPEYSKEKELATIACISRLEQVRSLKGEFQWTAEGRQTYVNWYNSNHERKKLELSQQIQGYLQSKGEYVLKLATLISLAETDELLLQDNYIQAALEFLTSIEPSMSKVFSGTGRNDLSPIAESLVSRLEACNTLVSKMDLQIEFYNRCSTTEFNEIVNHLSETGRIKHGILTKHGDRVEVIATSEVYDRVTKKFTSPTASPEQQPES